MGTFEEVRVDEVRRYWDERPCNVRHSPKPVGTREYFDEVEQRKYFVEPHILGFAEFERWEGKKVLEIGCGIGTDTINFARNGAQVTAVELSSKSLEIARSRADAFDLRDRIRFYEGNSEELTRFLEAESFDLIYSFGVVHHSPHPELILAQLSSYVRPGSTVKIMVYNRRSWKVLWILMTYGKGQFWKLHEIVARHSEAQTGCPITYTYTRKEIMRMLEKAGLEVVDVRVEHIFPYVIRHYRNYRYRKTWYFRLVPRKAFRWLERRWGWHLCVTARKM